MNHLKNILKNWFQSCYLKENVAHWQHNGKRKSRNQENHKVKLQNINRKDSGSLRDVWTLNLKSTFFQVNRMDGLYMHKLDVFSFVDELLF